MCAYKQPFGMARTKLQDAWESWTKQLSTRTDRLFLIAFFFCHHSLTHLDMSLPWRDQQYMSTTSLYCFEVSVLSCVSPCQSGCQSLTLCILFFRGLEGDKSLPLPLMLHCSICRGMKRREESLARSPFSCLSHHGGD